MIVDELISHLPIMISFLDDHAYVYTTQGTRAITRLQVYARHIAISQWTQNSTGHFICARKMS